MAGQFRNENETRLGTGLAPLAEGTVTRGT